MIEGKRSHHDNHSHQTTKSEKVLNIAIFANVLLTFVQIIGGLVSGSLALIADAVHNLSDAAALFVASIAIRIGKKPADERKTFGYRRAETIAALINFVVLVTIGVFLCIESIDRFLHPHAISGLVVSIIAGVALFIDLLTAYLVYKDGEKNMNMRAVIIHNIADALGSVAVIISGIIIHYYGWNIVDPILTIMIAVYIIAHGIGGLPKAVHLLMNGTPEDIDIDRVIKTIESIEGVENIHSVHIWGIDEKLTTLEGHVVLKNIENAPVIKKQIKEIIKNAYEIGHSTLEFETIEEYCHYQDKIHTHNPAS